MPAFADDRSSEISAALSSLPTGTPVSEVARRLLDLFTSGSIAPGTRLPPERQLAGTLGVGRSAVREALAALEILGVVDVRPGSGTYLRGTASELLPQTLRWGLLIGRRNTDELLELRSALEIHVARLAAERATDADLTRVGAHLERMRASTDDLPALVRADADFHTALGEAAGNSTLVDLLHIVRSLLQVHADRAMHDDEEARNAILEHDAIHRALRLRSQDATAEAMAAHMATASARLSAETAR